MSSAVGAVEGIKYGFKLLWYFLGVAIVGGIVSSIGFGMMASSSGGMYAEPSLGGMAFGFLLGTFGVAIVYAGVLGTGYKVIADAVYLGNITAGSEE